MDTFRTKLKKRLVLACVYNGMVLILIFTGNMIAKRFAVADIAIGFASGFFIGLQFVMIYFMRKYAAALKNDEKLKALYIEENDERTKFIEAQIGGTGINITLAGIAIGVVVSVFMDQTVFFTLLSTLIFTLFVKGGLKLYYRQKV